MSTVARSFRLKESVDSAISNLMKTESRSRNNIVEILLEEALANRVPRKKKKIKDIKA